MVITQFENGFITKSKLNELVDGINANSDSINANSDSINANTGDITDINAILSNIVVLDSEIGWIKISYNIDGGNAFSIYGGQILIDGGGA